MDSYSQAAYVESQKEKSITQRRKIAEHTCKEISLRCLRVFATLREIFLFLSHIFNLEDDQVLHPLNPFNPLTEKQQTDSAD
jgi:hypothetical protein